jgi:glutamine---fructose-6-phosphate transaminase (isomerizing)
VTNTAGSPLDLRSTVRLLTRAGDEATVSCKTYTSGLLALRRLALELSGQAGAAADAEAALAAPAVQAYLDHWREHCAQLEETLRGIEHVFLAGRGASLAACGTGGLITKESAHVHAEGMSSAALRHGPLEMLGPDCFVLVFAGDEAGRGLNLKLYEELRALGIPAGWAAPGPGQGPFCLPALASGLAPIAEILPVEMMPLALARMRGRTAGIFTRASKVTTTE